MTKPSISVLIAIKDRIDPLRFSLATHLWQECVAQVVLVDWTSRTPLMKDLRESDIPGLPTDKLTVVRVSGQKFWNLSKAYNVGMRFVTQPLVMKTDADICVLGDLAEQVKMPAPGDSFLTGSWRLSRVENENGLNGTMICGVNDFWKVGGYDERINMYGHDDDDLYNRLSKLGLKKNHIFPDALFHLPHSDAKRIENHEIKGIDPKRSVQVSKQKTLARPPWNRESPRVDFKVASKDSTPFGDHWRIDLI